jgi:hypothetical protein
MLQQLFEMSQFSEIIVVDEKEGGKGVHGSGGRCLISPFLLVQVADRCAGPGRGSKQLVV